ncbi:hypothetical protein V3C99_008252 [Haemonchus contortus]
MSTCGDIPNVERISLVIFEVIENRTDRNETLKDVDSICVESVKLRLLGLSSLIEAFRTNYGNVIETWRSLSI